METSSLMLSYRRNPKQRKVTIKPLFTVTMGITIKAYAIVQNAEEIIVAMYLVRTILCKKYSIPDTC